VRPKTRIAPVIALFAAAGVIVSGCESSGTTDTSSARNAAFLAAVAADHAVVKVDYSEIDAGDLVAAGQQVCADLADVEGTPDGIVFEGVTNRLVSCHDLDRATRQPGAEQDPGVPLRNADLRLASAIGNAALEHLCPDQPYNPAR
jgi:hypothetical protein